MKYFKNNSNNFSNNPQNYEEENSIIQSKSHLYNNREKTFLLSNQ